MVHDIWKALGGLLYPKLFGEQKAGGGHMGWPYTFLRWHLLRLLHLEETQANFFPSYVSA